MTNGSIRHRTSDCGPIGSTPALSFQIERGEIFGVVGFSGTGNATLLRLLGALDRRDRGRDHVRFHRKPTESTAAELRLAGRSVGLISQPLNLLHERSVLANVSFPLEIAGVHSRLARARAAVCLDWVGLADKSRAHPAQLSAAERRLLAVARTLAPDPDVLLCDDPTSALGAHCAKRILSTLQALNRDLGVTILLATQSLEVVREICHTVAVMESGVVAERIRLADLYAAPRTQLGRRLFAPSHSRAISDNARELTCA